MTATAARARLIFASALMLALGHFPFVVPAATAQETRTDLRSMVTAYRIMVGDVIRLRIWSGAAAPEALGDYPVEESGNVVLPRIGPVQVAGLGVEEMRARVREAASKVFTSSSVTANPIFFVSVMGAVSSPRQVEAVPGWTIFDAIAASGGWHPEADRTRVDLIRNGQRTTLNAETEEGLAAIAQTALQSNDRIFVHTRRRFNYAPLVFLAQIVGVAISLYSVTR